MINNDIKSNDILIEYVIKLGFVLAEQTFPNMTLYSKENGNHYEIYFTVNDNIETVFIKKYIPIENADSKWALDSRHIGFEKSIDLLNKEFKYELRKIKLKRILDE